MNNQRLLKLALFVTFVGGIFQTPSIAYGQDDDKLSVTWAFAFVVIDGGRAFLRTGNYWEIDLGGKNGDAVDETRIVRDAKIIIKRKVVVGSTESGEQIIDWIPVASKQLEIDSTFAHLRIRDLLLLAKKCHLPELPSKQFWLYMCWNGMKKNLNGSTNIWRLKVQN